MIMIMAVAIVVVMISGHDELHGISNDDKHDGNCDGHGIASILSLLISAKCSREQCDKYNAKCNRKYYRVEKFSYQ